MASDPICGLPFEIWDEIFSYLGGADLKRLERVSRLWKEHIQQRRFAMTIAMGMLNSKEFVLSHHPDFGLKLILTPKTPGLCIEINQMIARTSEHAPSPEALVQLAEFQAQLGRRKAAEAHFQEALEGQLLLTQKIMEGQEYIIDRMGSAQHYLTLCCSVGVSQLHFGWKKEAIKTIQSSIALFKQRMEPFVVQGILPQACVVGSIFDALPADCEIDGIIEELGNTPQMHQLWDAKVAVKKGDLQAAQERVLLIENDAFRSEGWHSIAVTGDIEAARQVRDWERSYTLIDMARRGYPVDPSEIPDQGQVDHIHIEIANRKAQSGDVAGAIQIARMMTQTRLQAQAFLGAFREMARQGQSKVKIIVAMLENVSDSEVRAMIEEGLSEAMAVGHADLPIVN